MSIFRSPDLAHLLDSESRGERHFKLGGLPFSLAALFTAALFQRSPRRTLIIVPGQAEAQALARALDYYLQANGKVVVFPAWDLLLYDTIAPNPETSAERIGALATLAANGDSILVMSAKALVQPTAPPEAFEVEEGTLTRGDIRDRDRLIDSLIKLGYYRLPQAVDRGDMAVRGGIVDFYPPNSPYPIRLEFAGDEIESLRLYEPDSQLSIKEIDTIDLLPAREILLDEQSREQAASEIGKLLTPETEATTLLPQLLESLEQNLTFPGIESLAPFFFGDLTTPLTYLGQDDRVIYFYPGRIDTVIEELFAEERTLVGDRLRRFATAGALGCKLSDLDPRHEFPRFPSIEFSGGIQQLGDDERQLEFKASDHSGMSVLLKASRSSERPLAPLAESLLRYESAGIESRIVCRTGGAAEWLVEALEGYGIIARYARNHNLLEDPPGPRRKHEVTINVGQLERGFHYPSSALSVLTEEEIFGRRTRRKRAKVKSSELQDAASTLEGLREDDLLVHADYGVGIYRGMVRESLADVVRDFLKIEYSDGNLKLPVESIALVQRYSGIENHTPRLDRLSNSAAWNKRKAKVRESVLKLAADLLDLYAVRDAMQGHAFGEGGRMYEEFVSSFEFEETVDQKKAIESVIGDMQQTKAMDRLVCGDVGFGKTEVALRAAFFATLGGRQVVILAPTTVLVEQHYDTFCERLGAFPVNVAALSRFRSKSEQKEILAGLKDGSIDIVIGTHRLLSRDVSFKQLGLMVIDEEQRFGVRHKEKLKQLKKLVDVLTLTATPIPRTLHMSMVGLRDLSIIASPPENRLAIRTYVEKSSEDLVRSAIRRELAREGQIFYVHNRVKSIDGVARKLAEMVPEARVVIGHAQMKPVELEKVMLDFYQGRFDVLLCTTIIESGLDIPRANTIIIDRADSFGLAELYQLRGRVGRSDRRAYCYLMVPPRKTLSNAAQRRIDVLASLSELGAGFRLAAHDMEIRGAGEVLGNKQHGQIAAVGFDLYNQLLQEAISEIKGERLDKSKPTEIKLAVGATIPEDYMIDPRDRLLYYKRISAVADENELWSLESQIADRYGRLPEEVERLMRLASLRIVATGLGIDQLDGGIGGIKIYFGDEPQVRPEQIVAFAAKPLPGTIAKMKGERELIVGFEAASDDEAVELTKNVLQSLV
jgi:transcription-repair coupling factor (superfamily II helicase)